MSGLFSVGNFGKEIYRTYVVDQPNHFAASLSYYSLFSLIPTIYIAFQFAGIFIDNAAVTQHMFAEIENLLSAGTKGLGWYLSSSKVGSFFEAAGSVALLLIAIYFLSQLFIFGAVFTRVFADRYGSSIRPKIPTET